MRDLTGFRAFVHLTLGVLALLFAMLAASLVHGAEAPASAPGAGVIRAARVLAPNHVRVQLAAPVENLDPANFRFSEKKAPDVPFAITEVAVEPGNRLVLTVDGRLEGAGAYRLEIREPASSKTVAPAPWALLLTIVMSAALINNFVFTRYLGLCVFFGVSKKRDTAIGMGVTFTAVMIGTAMASWILYTFVMTPLHLKFLQILVFIGMVAFVVQFLDTMLRKTHHTLHQRFGIYLMLITTNCVILAVPLLNAAAESGPWESLALSVGSGVGFAIALFLMSCARERFELARVPQSFEGLPIAFALAGLFALAFMGFSGLNFLR